MFFQHWTGILLPAWLRRHACGVGLAVVAALLCGMATRAALANSFMDFTRFYDGGVPGAGRSADYVAAWNALAAHPAGEGYGDYVLPSLDSVNNPGGARTNVASHYEAVVDIGISGTWSFRTSFDAGWGGTLIIDGVHVLQTRSTDMWWAGSWSDPAQYLQGTVDLSPGLHRLDVYSSEGCCDGPGAAQYRAPGASDYVALGTSLDGGSVEGLTAIPEPASLALLCMGVGGVMLYRRTRRRR